MDERVVYTALALLIGRMVAIFLLMKVVTRQYELLSANNDPEIQPLRKDLLRLSLVFLAGQILPVILDTAALFTTRVGWVLTLYAFSNMISTLAAVTILYKIYQDRREPH